MSVCSSVCLFACLSVPVILGRQTDRCAYILPQSIFTILSRLKRCYVLNVIALKKTSSAQFEYISAISIVKFHRIIFALFTHWQQPMVIFWGKHSINN